MTKDFSLLSNNMKKENNNDNEQATRQVYIKCRKVSERQLPKYTAGIPTTMTTMKALNNTFKAY